VELFIERTNETGGDNWTTDTEAMTIADLCRDLNGIPLAIELAARCVRSLGFAGLPSVTTDASGHGQAQTLRKLSAS